MCRQPGRAALLAVGLLVLSLSCYRQAAAQYVSSQSMDFTPADMYPFASLLVSKEAGPLCTATLVSSRAVLTAASCVTSDRPQPDLVFVGMSNVFLDPFRRKGQYEIQRVDRVVVHPGFRAGSPHRHNLALVLLNKRSRGTPVALPNASYAYPTASVPLSALGFGSMSTDGYWPQLHEDTLALLPQAECDGLQTAYGPPPGQVQTEACTALSHSFRACAAGNLGAPLLVPGAGPGAALQLALLSSGFSCSADPTVASASSPALYAWLPYYAKWLAAQLADAR